MTPRLGLALLALAILAPVSGRAQTAIVAGSCNNVMQNVKLAEGSTQVVEIDCLPDDPEKSFNIRYVWLDARNSSLALQEVFDPNLQKIFGSAPRLLKNDVYKTGIEIVRRFGHGINAGTSFYDLGGGTQVLGRGEPTSTDDKSFVKTLPAGVLKKLKFYAGESDIPWPDLEASRTARTTDQWPDGYALAYSADAAAALPQERKGREYVGALAACAMLYRRIDKAQYDDYWDAIDRLEKASLPESYFVNGLFGAAENFKGATVSNMAIDAIGYFTQSNWPDDFLVAVGSLNYDPCGGTTFGFYVPPRKLFMQFAVVEARARRLDLAGVVYGADGAPGLRDKVAADTEEAQDIGQVSLPRGESLLVPLRIELRYVVDEYPLSVLADTSAANDVRGRIQKLPDDPLQIVYDEQQEVDGKIVEKRITWGKKAKSAFKPPTPSKVTPRYIFGKAYELKRVRIADKEYEVRQAPAVAVVALSGGEEGSCPFLYFRSVEGDVSIKGRVLVSAHDASLERTDTVPIPPGMASLILAEEEPEISWIRSIRVRDRASGQTLELARQFKLRPRQSVEIDIPEPFRTNGELLVEGWYTPLLDQVSDAR